MPAVKHLPACLTLAVLGSIFTVSPGFGTAASGQTIGSEGGTASSQEAGWTADSRVVRQASRQRPSFNFDEAQVPPYDLPDPLLLDGVPVRTAEEWTERRTEILDLFRENVYGRSPGDPNGLRFEVVEQNPQAMGGSATFKRVVVTSTQGPREHRFELRLFLPNDQPGLAPVFLLLNHGSEVLTDRRRRGRSEYWPTQLIRRGYGVASVRTGDLAPDDGRRFRSGVMSLFEGSPNGPRAGNAWGALSAWAWGASRAMDYFQADPSIDSEKVAVVGHSRAGKAALWAGAQDERFALVISNGSGEGGAALSRRAYGETVAALTRNFPYWFAENYKAFAGREEALPTDQHMLMALMAPRAVYVASASDDLWADPKGEFLSLANASGVYGLWGEPPIDVDDLPARDRPLIRGQRGYHVRSGGHDLTLFDWERFADFADLIWRQ